MQQKQNGVAASVCARLGLWVSGSGQAERRLSRREPGAPVAVVRVEEIEGWLGLGWVRWATDEGWILPQLRGDLGSGSLAAGSRPPPPTLPHRPAPLCSVQLCSVITASQRGQAGKAPPAPANGSAGAAAVPNVEWLKFREKSWPGLGPVSEELGPRCSQGDFSGGISPALPKLEINKD